MDRESWLPSCGCSQSSGQKTSTNSFSRTRCFQQVNINYVCYVPFQTEYESNTYDCSIWYRLGPWQQQRGTTPTRFKAVALIIFALSDSCIFTAVIFPNQGLLPPPVAQDCPFYTIWPLDMIDCWYGPVRHCYISCHGSLHRSASHSRYLYWFHLQESTSPPKIIRYSESFFWWNQSTG